MNRHGRGLEKEADKAREDEQQLFIALVTGESNGTYTLQVNGREEVRQGVCSNEFTFETAGTGRGDEVLVLASPRSDTAQIIGLSPWSVHQ